MMDEYPRPLGTEADDLSASGRFEVSTDLEDVDQIVRDGEIWAVLPGDLESRVMGALTAAQQTAPADLSAHRSRRRSPRRGTFRRPLTVAAAAALVAVAAPIGIAALGGSGSYTMALSPTALAAGAAGEVELRDRAAGVEITLHTTGLAPAPPGTFYEGWVKGDRGAVAIGTFHLRSGPSEIVLWSGVDLSEYPAISVTLQSEDAGPASSGRVVLAGVVPIEYR